MVSGLNERAHLETNTRQNSPTLIAHRGFAGIYPENTLAAMRGAPYAEFTPESGDSNAETGGADAIEIDVVPAAGGEPVVFHDLTLGRLTDAHTSLRRQPVWETPVETLRNVSVLDSDESVPLLTEVMNTIPPEVEVHVELKHPGTGQPRRELDGHERSLGRERWLTFVERVVNILTAYDNDLLVSSSYEGALAAVRDIAPDLALAHLFWNSIEGGLDITRRYDCEAVHPALDMVTGTTLFNSGYTSAGPFTEIDVVERAHEEGREVNVWTLTTPQQATELRAAGVDGLITDYPGLFDREGSTSPSVAKPEDSCATGTIMTDAASND